MTAMGADESFEMRAEKQALVPAAFSPLWTPQTACPFFLNQLHKGLQDRGPIFQTRKLGPRDEVNLSKDSQVKSGKVRT